MSQGQLPLLARTPTSEVLEETTVQMAWALDGGRPVHIARYAHLAGFDDRPELTCLGCAVPVMPVLHRIVKGRTTRQDHFRHHQTSPDCWAHKHRGAMLWNVSLHLHNALREDAPARLLLQAWCDPTQNRWAPSLPLFGWGCTRNHALELPAYDNVRLSRVRRGSRRTPDLHFSFGSTEVLRVTVAPVDHMRPYQPGTAHDVPRVYVHVDEQTYPHLLAWRPTEGGYFPASHASQSLTWRCEQHVKR